jgi:hypothetical protein
VLTLEDMRADTRALHRLWIIVLAVGVTATGCTYHASRPKALRSGAPGPLTAAAHPTSSSTTFPAPTTSTTMAEQPGWTPVSYLGPAIAVDERSFPYPDGSVVTVARFRSGQVAFDLHVGSQDPPANLAALPADAQPAVSSTEAPRLLAAFNGGFKLTSGEGGFEVDGQTLAPLVDHLASFVIDSNGTGHVGIWGQDVPVPNETVASVRQNLPPLVLGSQPSPNVSDVAAWGSTLGGGAMVARSALGEDSEGDILYAGSMSTLPSDLASALIASGATTAMELDINPEWVQLALAPSAGAPLTVGVPEQNRPPNQFVAGWTRDFVSVVAAR